MCNTKPAISTHRAVKTNEHKQLNLRKLNCDDELMMPTSVKTIYTECPLQLPRFIYDKSENPALILLSLLFVLIDYLPVMTTRSSKRTLRYAILVYDIVMLYSVKRMHCLSVFV